MKVLHVLPAYYKTHGLKFEQISSYGGAERYAAELAKEMSKKQDTTLLVFGDANLTFYHKRLCIIVLKARPVLLKYNGYSNFWSIRLINVLRKYDIVHAHKTYTDTTVLCILMKYIFRYKLFVTDLGFKGINLARIFPINFFVNAVLMLSEYDRKRLNTPKNSTVIYGGVDLGKYSFENDKDKYIIFIGRILPHKGIEYLIKSHDDQYACYIFGQKYNNNYAKKIEEMIRNKNIIINYGATDDEIIKYLKKASVLVLPSVDVDYSGVSHKHPELFGLVIAEAFACGTPVIVSDSSALPFVVANGKDGFVVKQNDSLIICEKVSILFRDKKIAKQMGRNARDKAEKLYNWSSVTEKCMKAYGEY